MKTDRQAGSRVGRRRSQSQQRPRFQQRRPGRKRPEEESAHNEECHSNTVRESTRGMLHLYLRFIQAAGEENPLAGATMAQVDCPYTHCESLKQSQFSFAKGTSRNVQLCCIR